MFFSRGRGSTTRRHLCSWGGGRGAVNPEIVGYQRYYSTLQYFYIEFDHSSFVVVEITIIGG